MTGPFSVHTTPRFDRLLKKLSRKHPDLLETFAEALRVLKADPYNRTRSHPIKKLAGVPSGAGHYRLRIGRWRFRYNIASQDVELTYCGLRREETYR